MMLLGNGTVYGLRYYTVAPHQAGVSWRDMEQWCQDTFGKTEGSIWAETTPDPGQRWYVNNSKFWFRTEADRTWFVLRWQ